MNDSAQIRAPHDCGLCDGPLTFDGRSGAYATFICKACGWWHISTNCCESETNHVHDGCTTDCAVCMAPLPDEVTDGT